jgi:hypothetical protein
VGWLDRWASPPLASCNRTTPDQSPDGYHHIPPPPNASHPTLNKVTIVLSSNTMIIQHCLIIQHYDHLIILSYHPTFIIFSLFLSLFLSDDPPKKKKKF